MLDAMKKHIKQFDKMNARVTELEARITALEVEAAYDTDVEAEPVPLLGALDVDEELTDADEDDIGVDGIEMVEAVDAGDLDDGVDAGDLDDGEDEMVIEVKATQDALEDAVQELREDPEQATGPLGPVNPQAETIFAGVIRRFEETAGGLTPGRV